MALARVVVVAAARVVVAVDAKAVPQEDNYFERLYYR
jgi:hypothetical protein